MNWEITIDLYECLRWFCWISISLCATKAIMGFHFPWEICSCCKRKYREHKK